MGSLILIISQIIIFLPIHGSNTLEESLRISYIVMLSITSISILKYKNKISQRTLSFTFIMCWLPAYALGWISHVEQNATGASWTPFVGFKVAFFALVFLVPGKFLVNAILIAIAFVEAIVLYYYLDLAHSPNALIANEPFSLILYGSISLALLYLRYRDEQTINRLLTEQAKSEVYLEIARAFLGLRDRANTPLQNLTFSIYLLEKKYPSEVKLIHTLKNSLERLTEMTKTLNVKEMQMLDKEILMTESELLEWIQEMQKDIKD